MRWVALLRGINLGSHRRVAMADLRALLADLGHRDVETYLQSGNAVFTPGTPVEPDAVAAAIRDAVAAQLGVTCPVLVRTGEELAAVVAANPFPDAVDEPTLLHAVFLTGSPDPAWVASLDPTTLAPERLAVGDRVLYAYYAGGMRTTRLPLDERRLGVTATDRNWRTVTELVRRTAG